jgi:hypothetical protein
MATGLSSRERFGLRNKDRNRVMRFGTWNVRTVLQAGNVNMIAEGAERYKVDVVAVQEIRWKGTGSIRK